MKTAAVIAECNPFHKGHEYLIRTARERTGADRIIVLLSGNYVQRGIPAVTERHVRAKMAVLGGADLVLAYPTRFATASAEAFAFHAVQILDRIRCADYLVFGSESGNLGELTEAAAFFSEENLQFQNDLQNNLKRGETFARARAEAAGEYGRAVESPNNILAVEYLKALRKTGSEMKPFTVKRFTGENTADEKTSVYSASILRDRIRENPNLRGVEKEIPEVCADILKEDLLAEGTVCEDDLSLLLQDRLLRAETAEELLRYQDVKKEFAASAFRERNRCARFSEFAELMHTKNRTHSSVNRALLHIALGIREERFSEKAYWTQILSFRKDAGDLMHLIKENTSVPVIAKAADADKILSEEALTFFREEMRVCDIYGAIRAGKSGKSFSPEVSKPPVIV